MAKTLTPPQEKQARLEDGLQRLFKFQESNPVFRGISEDIIVQAEHEINHQAWLVWKDNYERL